MKYAFFPGCAFKNSAGYAQSLTALTRAVGIQLVEIPDWNCCGATVFWGINDIKALLLTARIFALARAHGFAEIVTGCNACFATLRKAAEKLDHDPGYLEIANRRLAAESLSLERGLPVRHVLQVLVDDLPPDTWRSIAKPENPVEPMAVANYYGCQLTRPNREVGDPEQPDLLERFMTNLGWPAVEHSAKTLCCGASHSVPYADACAPLVARIVVGAKVKGAELMATICPLCQFNLDQGQQHLRRSERLPVLFFTQVAGLAIGLPSETLGLNRLLIPAKNLLAIKKKMPA